MSPELKIDGKSVTSIEIDGKEVTQIEADGKIIYRKSEPEQPVMTFDYSEKPRSSTYNFDSETPMAWPDSGTVVQIPQNAETVTVTLHSSSYLGELYNNGVQWKRLGYDPVTVNVSEIDGNLTVTASL